MNKKYQTKPIEVKGGPRVKSVEVDDVFQGTTLDGLKTIVVLAPCADKQNGTWYCVTHDKRFDNQFQKDLHIHSGAHRLAWLCFKHGVEKP
jgi:hypothetical protein